MQWLDEKYINLISPRLERYRVLQRNPFKANFRCPYCGDSEKSERKARGNIYVSAQGALNFKCFNCGKGRSVENFIRDNDPGLHKEYVFERYRSGSTETEVPDTNMTKLFSSEEKEDKVDRSSLDELMDRVIDLPDEHRAVQYLKNRCITPEMMKEFYYIDDVQKIEELSPKYKNKIVGTEDRLCLPYYNRKGRIVGFTFRAIDDHPIKYLDIKITESETVVFNIDRVDLTRDVYVVEGPIDSLFIPNAVASGSSDLARVMNQVPPKNMILIYDNQPRNKEILKIMNKSIKAGFRHFIWPRGLESGDINDLIRNNECSIDGLPDLINSNTYQGLTLRAKFNEWKKNSLE